MSRDSQVIPTMYKIVENEDGSTAIYSSKTGQLICNVNSKKNPVGIGHPIPRTTNPVVSPSSLQTSVLHSKLISGQKRPESLESENCVKVEVSPIMNHFPDDESSSEDLPPLPSDDQDSVAGDFSDDCISQEEFLQCLGVIPTHKLEHNSCEDLRKEFPLRAISKTAESAHGTELQVKILEEVEISSPLGIRVLQSSPNHELDESGVLACISKCERYCQFSVGSSVPQLRNRELLIKYPVTYRPLKTWRTDKTFMYCFTKKQRLERLTSLQTGLSKRSRRLKRLCRGVRVNITRLSQKEIKSWLEPKAYPSTSLDVSGSYSGCSATNGMRRPSVMLNGTSLNNGNALRKHSVSVVLINNSVKSSNSVADFRNSFSCLPAHGPVHAGFPLLKPVKLFLQNGKPRLNTTQKVQHNFTSGSNNVDSSEDIEILFMKCPSVKSEHSFATCLRNSNKTSDDSFMKCSVPLQDVSKQIDKVGGKCFVKGTAIKACGMKGESKGSKANSVILNNCLNSHCITSNLLDHAYHRNHPLGNSARQTLHDESSATTISVEKNEPHKDREHIKEIAIIPRVAATFSSIKQCSPLFVKRVNHPVLHGFKYKRSVPSVLSHNGNNLHFKPLQVPSASVKVPQRTCSVLQKLDDKQHKKNIQVVDITEDSPCENISPVKNKPNALKWMFRCYGCGYRRMFFKKLDLDDAISAHMIKFHSVTDPKAFLNSFLNTEESAIVTEAFPGYKNLTAK